MSTSNNNKKGDMKVVSDNVDTRSNVEGNEELEEEDEPERSEGETTTIQTREETPTFPSNSGITPSLEDSEEREEEEEEEDNEYFETTKKTRNRASNDLLEWRRITSFQYYVTGKDIPWISKKMLVSQRTVERDISYMRHNAKQTMRKYFTQTLPEEVLKSLARLNAVNNAAWDMAESEREGTR
jgi:DNA-directed RNA polymerase specialized sigma24 family protein